MKKRLPFIFLGFVFFALFAGFTLAAKEDLFTKLDFNTTVRIHNHIPRQLDIVFSLFSFLASFQVITFLLFIFIILKRQLRGFIVFLVYASAHIVELVGKLFLDHPGPPFMFYRLKEPAFFFPENYVSGASYPSGHSLRAFFFAVIITYFVAKLMKNKPAAFFITAAVAFSVASSVAIGKVVLGHHWTSDVVAGSLLGLSFGFFAISIYQPSRVNSNK